MWFTQASPQGYLEAVLRLHLARARRAEDRGASTVEWVIITAILVAIAAFVGSAIYTKVTAKVADIDLDKASTP